MKFPFRKFPTTDFPTQQLSSPDERVSRWRNRASTTWCWPTLIVYIYNTPGRRTALKTHRTTQLRVTRPVVFCVDGRIKILKTVIAKEKRSPTHTE